MRVSGASGEHAVSRGPEALALARGDVRDGVAAIEHFLAVLASRRVGPRMLLRAVPEVEAGCAPLLAALAALGDALAAELGPDAEGLASVQALLTHAEGRVAELSAALTAHGGAAMDARVRLGVEAIVRRIAGELSEVLRLVDMVAAPVTLDTTAIDLADALDARRAGLRPGTAAVVHAPVELRTADLAMGDARLVMAFLEQAVAAVHRAGVNAPCLVVESGPEGYPVFTVSAGPPGPGALRFDALLREELPPAAHAAGVVQAAARHAGIRWETTESGRRVTLAL
jgi:hypothetical protein